MITERELNDLLPLVCIWAQQQEEYIMDNGSPLNFNIQKDAELIGITNIHKVRLLSIDEIQLPSEPVLKSAIKDSGLIGPNTIGLTFRYGIYINKHYWNDKRLVIHELTHTMQYERAGGFLPFLKQYLQECIEKGYPNGSLEQEAIFMANKLCP